MIMKNNSLKYLPHLAVLFLTMALCHYEEDCGWYDTLCFNYPYGFYVILRFVVCIYFSLTAYFVYSKDNKPFCFIVMCLFAIIYNPFVKVPFEVEIWLFINAISAFIIIVYELKKYKRNKEIMNIVKHKHIPFNTKECMVWQNYKDCPSIIATLSELKEKYPDTLYKSTIEDDFTILANENLLKDISNDK